jgi:hypothetical protein
LSQRLGWTATTTGTLTWFRTSPECFALREQSAMRVGFRIRKHQAISFALEHVLLVSSARGIFFRLRVPLSTFKTADRLCTAYICCRPSMLDEITQSSSFSPRQLASVHVTILQPLTHYIGSLLMKVCVPVRWYDSRVLRYQCLSMRFVLRVAQQIAPAL